MEALEKVQNREVRVTDIQPVLGHASLSLKPELPEAGIRPCLEEEAEMAKALRLPLGGKVYAVPIMNLTYYIQYIEGQPPKVVFLSPLAW